MQRTGRARHSPQFRVPPSFQPFPPSWQRARPLNSITLGGTTALDISLDVERLRPFERPARTRNCFCSLSQRTAKARRVSSSAARRAALRRAATTVVGAPPNVPHRVMGLGLLSRTPTHIALRIPSQRPVGFFQRCSFCHPRWPHAAKRHSLSSHVRVPQRPHRVTGPSRLSNSLGLPEPPSPRALPAVSRHQSGRLRWAA